MKRNNAYYRWQRNRTINRKTGIIRFIWSADSVEWALEKSGKFAKGKIHCSCRMCRFKSSDSLTHKDTIAKLSADQQLAEHRQVQKPGD